jgi:hypothetical protein
MLKHVPKHYRGSMSEPSPQYAGPTAGVADAGVRILTSLPAQFLMLVLLNAIFIGGLLWFLDQRQKSEERIMDPLMKACMAQVPADLLEQVLRNQNSFLQNPSVRLKPTP